MKNKVALTLMNMVESTMTILGPFDHIQVTYGIIRPLINGTYTDRELTPDDDNFYTYQGKRYSDFFIEPIDAEKHKYIQMIKQDDPRIKEVADIVAKLKTLSGDGLDGETMQYILEAVGMEGQMLSQLVRGTEHLEQIEDMIDEARELQGIKEATPRRRLLFIQDDLASIRKVIEANDEKIYELEAHPECAIGTLLNNIQIACDLNDDEPNNWKTNKEEFRKANKNIQVAFDLIKIVTCEDCKFEFTVTEANTLFDNLGKHTVCPNCTSSFNI